MGSVGSTEGSVGSVGSVEGSVGSVGSVGSAEGSVGPVGTVGSDVPVGFPDGDEPAGLDGTAWNLQPEQTTAESSANARIMIMSFLFFFAIKRYFAAL